MACVIVNTAACMARSLRITEQDGSRYSQAIGDPLDVVYRDISFTALDPTEIRPVHFDLESEVLLADTASLAVSADICGNNCSKWSRVRAFHAPRSCD